MNLECIWGRNYEARVFFFQMRIQFQPNRYQTIKHGACRTIAVTNEKHLWWTTIDRAEIEKIRVFRNNDPSFTFGDLPHFTIGKRQTVCEFPDMYCPLRAALRQPACQTRWQLRVDKKLHAALSRLSDISSCLAVLAAYSKHA